MFSFNFNLEYTKQRNSTHKIRIENKKVQCAINALMYLCFLNVLFVKCKLRNATSYIYLNLTQPCRQNDYQSLITLRHLFKKTCANVWLRWKNWIVYSYVFQCLCNKTKNQISFFFKTFHTKLYSSKMYVAMLVKILNRIQRY